MLFLQDSRYSRTLIFHLPKNSGYLEKHLELGRESPQPKKVDRRAPLVVVYLQEKGLAESHYLVCFHGDDS